MLKLQKFLQLNLLVLPVNNMRLQLDNKYIKKENEINVIRNTSYQILR